MRGGRVAQCAASAEDPAGAELPPPTCPLSQTQRRPACTVTGPAWWAYLPSSTTGRSPRACTLTDIFCRAPGLLGSGDGADVAAPLVDAHGPGGERQGADLATGAERGGGLCVARRRDGEQSGRGQHGQRRAPAAGVSLHCPLSSLPYRVVRDHRRTHVRTHDVCRTVARASRKRGPARRPGWAVRVPSRSPLSGTRRPAPPVRGRRRTSATARRTGPRARAAPRACRPRRPGRGP